VPSDAIKNVDCQGIFVFTARPARGLEEPFRVMVRRADCLTSYTGRVLFFGGAVRERRRQSRNALTSASGKQLSTLCLGTPPLRAISTPQCVRSSSPPFPRQKQPMPGDTAAMRPKPDHGEQSYRGSDKLAGRKAVITGADSGIGRAVAIAFAREGADVLIAYLNEHDDAKETQRLVEEAGRKAVLLPGDIQSAAHCRKIIDTALTKLGGIDILVNNAAHQATFKSIEDISDEEWELTFRVNIHAMFYLTKAAVPHMKPGSAIINTASINADTPNPTLLAYATTKGAIQNFTAGLAHLLGEKGIRANAVAPGPIWTPLIPSTMSEEAVENFGKQVPMKRPGQPAELATAYVMLADPLSSYVSGATIAVTGGKPIL
jgi:NAD(P)-dependent dehydrogenase (short-subunit alcohol dehydrogenase family)